MPGPFLKEFARPCSSLQRPADSDDATTNILEVVAEGREPSFYVNEKVAESTEVDPQVALKLAKRYAMYKVAGICAIMDGKCGGELDEDELVFVAAAQDLMK